MNGQNDSVGLVPGEHVHADTDMIDKRVQDILSEGKIVEFRHKQFPELRKFVAKWNQNAMGDLKAIHSTGTTHWVCTYARDYEIIPMELADFNMEFGEIAVGDDC